MNYDWESEERAVSLNFCVAKTLMYGKMPFKIEVEINYDVEQLDTFDPDRMIGLNLTPCYIQILLNDG